MLSDKSAHQILTHITSSQYSMYMHTRILCITNTMHAVHVHVCMHMLVCLSHLNCPWILCCYPRHIILQAFFWLQVADDEGLLYSNEEAMRWGGIET